MKKQMLQKVIANLVLMEINLNIIEINLNTRSYLIVFESDCLGSSLFLSEFYITTLHRRKLCKVMTHTMLFTLYSRQETNLALKLQIQTLAKNYEPQISTQNLLVLVKKRVYSSTFIIEN